MSQKGTDFDSVNTQGGAAKARITDIITPYEMPEKTWVTLRPHGKIHSYATYWVKVKKQDGKTTKFPVVSPSYDPETQQFDTTKYDPWFELYQKQKDEGVEQKDQLIQISVRYWTNMISRKAQRNAPRRPPKPTKKERKTGFKDKDSDTYTIWVPVGLPSSVIGKIKKLKGLNTKESKKTGNTTAYSVADEKYGCDIKLYFDPDVAPANQYDVQKGEGRSPLTEEELKYLKWDTSCLMEPTTDEKAIRRDFEGWAKRMGIKTTNKKRKHDVDEDEDELDEDQDTGFDDDDDEDDEPKKGKKGKGKGKAKAKPAKGKKGKKSDDDEDDDDLDDDDDDLDDDEDEDDEDEKPKKGKKSKAKPAKGKKGKKSDDDEDEDEDEDDEDEDEDEDDEDDDSDSDDDDDDDDDDSDSDDDEDDEDDEDEDDEDDEDEDEDDEDDEDEKPKRGKGKVKAKAKAKAKAKPAKKAAAKKTAKGKGKKGKK